MLIGSNLTEETTLCSADWPIWRKERHYLSHYGYYSTMWYRYTCYYTGV